MTYFLSEMSALPLVGGGITLGKVLGDDLRKFNGFIKSYHNEGTEIPTYSHGVSICAAYTKMPWLMKRIIGSRFTFYFENHPLRKARYTERVAKLSLSRLGRNLSHAKFLVCPNSAFSLSIFKKISRRYNNQYVTWIMDDHLVQWSAGQWKYSRENERHLRDHLQNAKMVYVISEAMADFYKDKFSVEAQVLHAPCASVPTDELCLQQDRTGPLRLVYFGSLGRWQNDAIEGLVPFILDKTIEFHIYTRNFDEIPGSCRDLPGVFLHYPIAAHEIISAAKNFDAMVLPISFKEDVKNMSFFNIATKFPDCIGAPIPTIIIGPSDSIMMKTAKKYGTFATIERLDFSAIKDALQKISNPDARASMLAGRRLAFQEMCGPNVMSARWKPAAEFLFN